jgi:hypothetical protein
MGLCRRQLKRVKLADPFPPRSPRVKLGSCQTLIFYALKHNLIFGGSNQDLELNTPRWVKEPAL